MKNSIIPLEKGKTIIYTYKNKNIIGIIVEIFPNKCRLLFCKSGKYKVLKLTKKYFKYLKNTDFNFIVPEVYKNIFDLKNNINKDSVLEKPIKQNNFSKLKIGNLIRYWFPNPINISFMYLVLVYKTEHSNEYHFRVYENDEITQKNLYLKGEGKYYFDDLKKEIDISEKFSDEVKTETKQTETNFVPKTSKVFSNKKSVVSKEQENDFSKIVEKVKNNLKKATVKSVVKNKKEVKNKTLSKVVKVSNNLSNKKSEVKK